MDNTMRTYIRNFILVILIICFYIILVSFPIDTSAGEWKAPAKAANRLNPVPKNKTSIKSGKQLFLKYCATCHGNNGQGDGILSWKLNPKPANLKEQAGNHSDGDFAWKITNGKGSMPAFKDKLSENEIWQLTNFIQSWKIKKESTF
jgi:mono/diheme cytochrome c family protein